MPGRILVIDPTPTSRIVLQVKLSTARYEVVTLETCADANARLAHDAFDLAIVSDHTFDGTGEAFCRRLRAAPATRTMPILLLTDGDDADAHLAGLEAGADAILTRPVEEVALLARVRSLMRARVEARDLEGQGAWLSGGMGGTDWDDRAPAPGPVGTAPDRRSPAAPVKGRVAVLAPPSAQPEAMAGLIAPALLRRPDVVDADAILTATEADAPDLVLIDADLDGWSGGLRLMSELRSRPATRRTACIVLLPQGESERAATALDLGAADVVHKPILSRELSVRVRTQLARKRQGDRMRAAMEQGLRLAVVDPLTGLYNRRYGLHHLDQVAARVRADGRPAGVILLDVDHFKAVNDTHGHPVGDHVLATVAQTLRANLRSDDLVARIGGEEFLVVLADAPQDRLQRIAERLRAAVAACTVHANGQALSVTVSAGIADLDECADAAAKAMADVDRALYDAKARGRNRVDRAPRQDRPVAAAVGAPRGEAS